MDKNKRWKEITVLFLISVAIFGIAEDSGSREQVFIEAQGQITDIEMWGKMADTDLQVGGNGGETEERETESERVSGQETGSENASGHETGDGDISEQKAESENAVINYEELQCICRSGKYGYIDEAGKTVIPFDYDDAGAFVEGLAYFCIGEDYGFMDESLTPVFYLDCDSVSSFQGGLAYFTVDGKYGYIDQRGETVIEPAYQDAGYFQDGCAIILKNGKYGVVDKTGKEITEPKYEEIDSFQDGFAYVKKNGKVGVINSAGKEIIEPKYQEIGRGGGCFILEEKERFQVVDGEGEPLLETPVENVEYNNFVVQFHDREHGMYGYVGEGTVVRFEEDYEVVSFVPQRKLIIIKENEIYGIRDYQGNVKIPFEYKYMNYDEDDDSFYMRDMDGNLSSISADEFVGRINSQEVRQEDARQERWPDVLQYNKLTPRVLEFQEFLQNGVFFVEDMSSSGHETSPSKWDGDEKIAKLYDFGKLGSPALYLYGQIEGSAFGTPVYSGFFTCQGGEVVCLVSGYDGGGSGGGDSAKLFYDNEEGKLLPGQCGGYKCGSAYWGNRDIYDFIDGECSPKVIFYEESKYPYPEGGMPTELYYVNGEETTEEHYRELRNRYSVIEMIR